MIETLFGHGKDLDTLQMSMRALVLFAMTIVLIRIAGMRAFGRKSSYDTVIVIMLGAVLSRAVVGASPFWPTVAASLVLVVAHRIVAMICVRSAAFDHLIRGKHRPLYTDGVIDWRTMQRGGISRGELESAVRKGAHSGSLHAVEQIVLESSGELTVIERGGTAAQRLTASRSP